MKAFGESRVVIIGMGFLMEYIFPCFRAAMGEKTAEQIMAVTADAEDLEGKQERLGIRVLLNDNSGALEQMDPDYIFFAPPPSVAPKLAKEVLLPFYEKRRRQGGELPVLFAFPPSPAGAFYLELLGADVKVVNVIPNMFCRFGDEVRPEVAAHLITYPEHSCWSTTEREELRKFFAAMGKCMDVLPERILQVLSAEIAAHPLTELADIAARTLTEKGIACTYAQTAGAMRAVMMEACGYQIVGEPCRADMVPDEEMAGLLGKIALSWYQGLRDFLTETGMDREEAADFLLPRFDFYFRQAQTASREAIVAKAKKDATKGGMLELCMEEYYAAAEPRIRALILSEDRKKWQAQADQIGCLMAEITASVVERGRGLHKGEELVFSPRQHAVMFGLLAREILKEFGDEGDTLLMDAVARYGQERGFRMARRCERRGSTKDMVGYFAYSEWSWPQGFRKAVIQTEPYFAHYVYECPWCSAWKESGLSEYGRYYCRNVDENIVKGFNPELHLEMKSYLSAPEASCCEFHWKDAVMDEKNGKCQAEIQGQIGTSCLRDFAYHTAHTFCTLLDEAAKRNSQKADQIEKTVRREFAAKCSYQELVCVLTESLRNFSEADEKE